jgi:hypothetical protein
LEEPPTVESAGGATNGASAAETRTLWERDSEAKAQAATDTRLLADQVAAEEKKALACKAEHGVYSTMHGVSWTKSHRQWSAKLTHDGTKHNFGYHREEEAAARAFDKGARRLRGERAHIRTSRQELQR